jgi:hypothetical protein
MAKYIKRSIETEMEIGPAVAAALGALGAVFIERKEMAEAMRWVYIVERWQIGFQRLTSSEKEFWAKNFVELLGEAGVPTQWKTMEVDQ